MILERFNTLKHLVRLISLHDFQKLVAASEMSTGQSELMINELTKCNKTARVLPEYEAQNFTRTLYKARKHSDVGGGHFELYLNFY